jgi:cytochrome d ubiquinol oxidase subunit I
VGGIAALALVDQQYLDQARQMQALSFAVHIPLVCFGIAFPGLVVFTEWIARRTGDAVYLALARRWSKSSIRRHRRRARSART